MTARKAILRNGVKMLREFGYPECDLYNIHPSLTIIGNIHES